MKKAFIILSIALMMGACANQEKNCPIDVAALEIEATGTEIIAAGEKTMTVGALPKVGEQAPNFILTSADLSEKSLSDYQGKVVILNIFPSLDTKVCQASVRKFNEEAAQLKNTVILGVSVDLPFATSRFCELEGIENVIPLSAFRSNFGNQYGVKIASGKLKGLLSRAIVVIDSDGKVIYTEQVSDISYEPNYQAALEAIPN